jgi:pimeloyl-ACP methyl ester carboxylesterase
MIISWLEQLIQESPLSDGRAKLCRIYNSYRAKLQASDDNQIDVVFIDKRGSPDAKAKGNKLIICCEGNAAYYELGLLEIPLTVGYSVLGWNHPGFAESTGLPFPDQEFCAIDVVVRYAVCRLGFKYEDIYLFAWSIGGYTASCAAMSYPKIAGVILDATFDELFPLAQLRVPTYFQGFTRGMVEEYYNLNIAEQMCRYHGPLLIIRRQHDEMMTFNNNISTNRANYLLIKILQNRYPNLMTPESLKQLWAWLNCINDWDRSSVISSAGVSDSRCKGLLVQYVSINGEGYPWLIGDDLDIREKTRLLLYLATQYMKNCDSTHCAPLPHRFLHKLPEKFFNNS